MVDFFWLSALVFFPPEQEKHSEVHIVRAVTKFATQEVEMTLGGEREGKAVATNPPVSRRRAMQLGIGGAAAVAGFPAPAVIAADKPKLLIGVPSSLSTPYGVADDTDHLNGTTMAIEEIN